MFTAAPIVDIDRADYARVFDINVAGTLFTLQAVARHMIDRGIKGRIINMASQAGRRGEPLVAVYCATKAAVISLTQSAGLNLIQHGINVNAISPGVVDGEALGQEALADAGFDEGALGDGPLDAARGVVESQDAGGEDEGVVLASRIGVDLSGPAAGQGSFIPILYVG